MSERSNNGQLADAPRALVSTNPLRWFRFFGPGAIVASVTIGSGELVFPSRGGAIFGYKILWLFLVGSLLKWLFAYASMRHMILSGAHPFQRWTHLPGPKGWLPLLLVIFLALGLPVWFAFLSGALGNHCVWWFGEIFGGGQDASIWATICLLAAFVILLVGRYAVLEKLQMAVLAVMLVGVFFVVIYVEPDWLAVLQGVFVPERLSYPDWALEKYPRFQGRSVWVEVALYVAAIGGQGADYLGYVSFMREKKWGWAHVGPIGSDDLARTADDPAHPARLWVRAAWIDSVVSLAMVVVIAGAFVILGTVILGPDHNIPSEDQELLSHQAKFLTELAPWLEHLYAVSVFLAFFGILFGSPEISYRVFYEYFQTMPRLGPRWTSSKVRTAIVAWPIFGGIVVLWGRPLLSDNIRLDELLTPAGMVTGVLACGLCCLAAPWADYRFLPTRLRMSKSLAIGNLLAGVAFLVFTVRSFAEYDHKAYAFAAIAFSLAAALSISWMLRRNYEE